MLDFWWLVIFGFFIGILASMTGVGGGVFIVPILTFFYGFIVNSATGTSLTTIIFTAIASTINYSRQKRIYYKTGLILVLTTAPGAYIGAWFATI
ncbi:sulfite exporter TauE/SafE family protein, partial [Candidatus Bathyarchaeota archaeon]|nr:sulfite exporter TauE/SafE family protein [Candidatus Bathyarchaeota archaeon]